MRSKIKRETGKGIALAILAASLYAINSPCSKLLLNEMPATIMAGFLYVGAGLSMIVVALLRKARGSSSEMQLTRAELPYTVMMVVLDIAAPICLLWGLTGTTAANASLLNNFEIVATALIAWLAFRESISRRLWLGIVCITISCLILSFEDMSSVTFSYGSLLVLLACVCWGLENNCTRKLSSKDPMQIVILKGIGSGGGSLIIGFCFLGERLTSAWSVFAVLAVGAVAYGMSIFFYVYAQRILGAAKTSAYYAAAPFIGTLLSLLIFQEIPPAAFFVALVIMLLGAWLSA